MAPHENETFTLSEILSQPAVWAQTVENLDQRGDKALPNLAKYDQVVFIGCGSTYYLSIWAARLCQIESQVCARALPSSELWFSTSSWLLPQKKTLLVAISRSGRTSETIEALKAYQAGRYGETVVITCYPETELAQMGDWLIDVPAAQETSVAQTRSFTNMMLAVAYLLSGSAPPIAESEFTSSADWLFESHRSLANSLGQDGTIERFFYLGSGPNFGLASEAMLKMKEMSLSYSEVFHFLEFRHGPISMVNDRSLVVGLTDGTAYDQAMAVLQDVKKLGARTLAITPASFLANGVDFHLPFVSTLDRSWVSPFYLPFLQLLAHERAIAEGLDPDKPQNLDAVVVLNGNSE